MKVIIEKSYNVDTLGKPINAEVWIEIDMGSPNIYQPPPNSVMRINWRVGRGDETNYRKINMEHIGVF